MAHTIQFFITILLLQWFSHLPNMSCVPFQSLDLGWRKLICTVPTFTSELQRNFSSSYHIKCFCADYIFHTLGSWLAFSSRLPRKLRVTITELYSRWRTDKWSLKVLTLVFTSLNQHCNSWLSYSMHKKIKLKRTTLYEGFPGSNFSSQEVDVVESVTIFSSYITVTLFFFFFDWKRGIVKNNTFYKNVHITFLIGKVS